MLHAKHLWILRVTLLQSWIVTWSLTNCRRSLLSTEMFLSCDKLHCLEPRASLWWQMPHFCHFLLQNSLLVWPAHRSEATGTASRLTVWYLLSVPTDVPSGNACEVGWEVIFQELSKSKKTVLLS